MRRRRRRSPPRSKPLRPHATAAHVGTAGGTLVCFSSLHLSTPRPLWFHLTLTPLRTPARCTAADGKEDGAATFAAFELSVQKFKVMHPHITKLKSVRTDGAVACARRAP